MSTAATLTVNGRTVLGTFSKGVTGSAALNFGQSGGKNCAKVCPFHPESNAPNPDGVRCYAVRVESRPDRKQLAAKLQRHEDAKPADVVRAADAECKERAYRLPWFRVSAFGSVPPRVPLPLVRLLWRLADAGTPIHLPVESKAKRDRYQLSLGKRVAVRWSAPTAASFLADSGIVSTVAGSMNETPRERVRAAADLARERREKSGRACVVCPAVAARHLRTGSKSAKCGLCTACADPGVDVVYPAHA